MDQRTPLNLSYDAVAVARQVAAAAAGRAHEQDRNGGFPAEDIADLARLGLLAAPIPSDEGGIGLGEERGACKLAAVLRLVGYGSLALGRIYEGHVNALQLVARYGNAGQRARLFADASEGHLFGVWNTDPPGDCLRLGDNGRLQGLKAYASGAGFVTRALVTVKQEPGAPPLMLVVPLEPGSRADLSSWRAHGMRASATGTVDFEDITVGDDEILGEVNDYHRQPTFSGGAWRFTAVQLGGIEAVFDTWREHLQATGRGADPHQLAHLGEGAIAVQGARQWVERAALTLDEEELAPERIVAFVNLTRLAVERAGLDVLRLAQQSVGLQGFLCDHPLERLSRDLATYLRQPAPDRALTTAAEEILQGGGLAGDLWTAGAASRYVTSLPPSYFDKRYAADPDPWRFATSDYERAKYAATLDALPQAHYAHALEVGCSIGVMTKVLARRCDDLVSLDLAERALVQARERCQDMPHVRFELAQVPGQWPDGSFDLILLSEVVYYLDADDVERLAERIRGCLRPGGDVVLVHWTGETHYPLTGDEAAEHFIDKTRAFLRINDKVRTDKYRLDVLVGR